jgi:hypothetical protein
MGKGLDAILKVPGKLKRAESYMVTTDEVGTEQVTTGAVATEEGGAAEVPTEVVATVEDDSGEVASKEE